MYARLYVLYIPSYMAAVIVTIQGLWGGAQLSRLVARYNFTRYLITIHFSMDRWAGRVAIVTGASSGIGAAIAKLLAEKGMKVVGAARRLDRVKSLATEVKGELHPVQCDITKEDDIIRLVKWVRDNLGGADVLVNNAGVSNYMPLTELDTAKARAMLDTNVLGLSVMTREFLKDMKDRGVNDGHIFHINSICGQRLVDFPGSWVYAGSKYAVTVLTEGLRRELRDLKSKTKVTSISPGIVRSEIRVASGRLTLDEAKEYYDNNPSLEPEDIANGLLYALSTPPHVQVHELTINPVGQQC